MIPDCVPVLLELEIEAMLQYVRSVNPAKAPLSQGRFLVPGLEIKVVFYLFLVLNAETQSSRRYAEILTLFSAILPARPPAGWCGLGVSAIKTTILFL